MAGCSSQQIQRHAVIRPLQSYPARGRYSPSCIVYSPSASLVSWRVVLSTFSLNSLASIIVIFLEFSIWHKSSDRPQHKVLTFQLASCRAGSFFVLVLLGAMLQSACWGVTLSSRRPLKQANRSWLATSWLVSVKLDARSIWLVGLNDCLLNFAWIWLRGCGGLKSEYSPAAFSGWQAASTWSNWF